MAGRARRRVRPLDRAADPPARRRVGAHKTSMLQDLESGRPTEIDAMVGAVVELGDRLQVTSRT